MVEENSNEAVITSVQQQKQNRSRYNVFIKEEFAFAVHEDILLKYRLFKGRTIEPEELKDILKAEEKNRAKQFALLYLGRRPRTEWELHRYLREKGFIEEDCTEVIASFKEMGYVNDQLYAKQWVSERNRLKPRGRHLLKHELMQKGIDESMADQAIEERLQEEEEREIIETLIRKKLKGQRFERRMDMKKKIVPYLQRKGFPLHTILSVVDGMEGEYLGTKE